ncbi:MAG: hypothetical protein R3F49_22960 [Planctomycetota bacterium]
MTLWTAALWTAALPEALSARPGLDATAWSSSLPAQTGVLPLHHGVRAMPNGDTLSVVTRSNTAVDVLRLDTNGDVVSSTVVPLQSGQGDIEDLRGFDVDGSGDVVLLLQTREPTLGLATQVRVVRIDAIGAVAWTRAVTTQASRLVATSIEFAANNEIIIAAGRKDSWAPYNQLGAWTIWLDHLGNRLRSSFSPAPAFLGAVAEDGTARVVRVSGQGTVLERINADGTLAWSTLVSPSQHPWLQGLWVGPAGQTVAILSDDLSANFVLSYHDALGALVWSWTGPEAVARTNHVQFLPGGELLTSGPMVYGFVRRFSAAGTPRFDLGSLVFPDGASSAVVDALDRTWLIRINASTPQVLVSRIDVLDPNGALIDSFTPPVLNAADGFVTGMAADQRGNVFAGVRYLEAPTQWYESVTVKFVLGVAGAAQGGCAQGLPNSTGVYARLRGAGSEQALVDGLSLFVDQLPPSTLLLPLVAPTAASVPMAGGSQGTLCLGGAIGRFSGPGQVRLATPTGVASFQVPLDRIPRPTGLVQGMVGETWHFQGWYRDTNPSATSNFTNAWEVTLR